MTRGQRIGRVIGICIAVLVLAIVLPIGLIPAWGISCLIEGDSAPPTPWAFFRETFL